ncbi:MAG: hypothetical protein DHS20C17_33570 [Cyclobacteriaceae bacterium]|nr:MAG: hypothetical protein DHS20C17_33570 [Cyclobacteriaceae bacterium]
MEPSDFDKLVKEKLQQNRDLYRNERETAKPFIWSAIQTRIAKNTMIWSHLAAAMVLLLVGISLVFYLNKRTYQKEMVALSQKVGKLQENYQAQLLLLQVKEAQVDSLTDKLKNIAQPLIDLPQKERIIYKTDTVFVKQIEHITTVSIPEPPNENMLNDTVIQTKPAQSAISQQREIDDLIYPNYSSLSGKQKQETLKFKLGSFTARKD